MRLYICAGLSESPLQQPCGPRDVCFCLTLLLSVCTGPRSAVGNVSGYRCVSDCRSRGREFDPGPVPYFRGD